MEDQNNVEEQNVDSVVSEDSQTKKGIHQSLIISLLIGTVVLVFAAGMVAYINYGMNNTPADVQEEQSETEQAFPGFTDEELDKILQSLEQEYDEEGNIVEREPEPKPTFADAAPYLESLENPEFIEEEGYTESAEAIAEVDTQAILDRLSSNTAVEEQL